MDDNPPPISGASKLQKISPEKFAQNISMIVGLSVLVPSIMKCELLIDPLF